MSNNNDGYIIPPGPTKVAEPPGPTVDAFGDPPKAKDKQAPKVARTAVHDPTDFSEKMVFD